MGKIEVNRQKNKKNEEKNILSRKEKGKTESLFFKFSSKHLYKDLIKQFKLCIKMYFLLCL